MADSADPKVDHIEDEFDLDVYRLVSFYELMMQTVNSFLRSGLEVDYELNKTYLRLCHQIDTILQQPGFEELAAKHGFPFDDLMFSSSYENDMEVVYWFDAGRKSQYDEFLSYIQSWLILAGKKNYSLNPDDRELIEQSQACLLAYNLKVEEVKAKKRALRLEREAKEERIKEFKQREDELNARETKLEQREREFEKLRKQVGENSQIPQDSSVKQIADARFFEEFAFVQDKELKFLIEKDLQEAKKAFESKLFKATLVLCVAIIEALLKEALISVKDETKPQKQGHQKVISTQRPDETVERRDLIKVIDEAKRQRIIKRGAAGLADVMRDYRNSIHIYAQKDIGVINEHIASSAISTLNVICEDIKEWRREKDKTN